MEEKVTTITVTDRDNIEQETIYIISHTLEIIRTIANKEETIDRLYNIFSTLMYVQIPILLEENDTRKVEQAAKMVQASILLLGGKVEEAKQKIKEIKNCDPMAYHIL